MNNYKKIISIILILLGISVNNSILAQYVIEQTEQEIPIDYNVIPEELEFDSFEEESNFIMNIDSKKLINAAEENGLEIFEDKMTMYLDGTNFAVESNSHESGKVTMVSDANSGMMYTIMWDQKKVLEVGVGDIQEIEDKSKAMAEQMLQNLPEEYRDQVMAEMETTDEEFSSNIEIVPTGDKKQLFGFKCEGFKGFQDEEAMLIWASNDNIGIVNEIKSITEKFSEMFNSDDDDIDEWDLVPGKIPVQVKKLTDLGMYGDPVISITSITNIEKKQPPKETFYIPGEKDGFTRETMMDMMMQMVPGETP